MAVEKWLLIKVCAAVRGTPAIFALLYHRRDPCANPGRRVRMNGRLKF
jgi:hypothetical protein